MSNTIFCLFFIGFIFSVIGCTDAPHPIATGSGTPSSEQWSISLVRAALPEEDADLVLSNGKVITWEGTRSTAVAIRSNRIVWVGDERDLERWIAPNTLVINAQGASITPGFNDAHAHFVSGALSMQQIQLLDAPDLPSIRTAVQEYLKSHPDVSTVIGRGWLYGAFPDGLPHREILDEWVPDRPALLRCYDGHTLWVNSVALRLANIDRTTKNPERGIIVKDPETGEPTGVLKESAQRLVDHLYPKPTHADKREAIRKGIALAHRLGITSIQEAGTDPEDLAAFESLRRDGELLLRTHMALSGKPGMKDLDFEQLHEDRQSFRALNTKSVKLFVDGVIESHTAVLLSPYTNRPTAGLPLYTDADLQRTIQRLDAEEWQIMVHAIGEGGVRMVLDAFELAIKSNSMRKTPRRHRLEHIESIAEEDIPRFAQLGLIASMQPLHAEPNSNTFQVWAVNLGAERAKRAWVWKRFLDTGAQVAFGTDWPVVGLDPRPGLHVAMTRQTLSGEPPEGFVPSQRLSLHSALRAYTEGSAYAEMEEKEKGTIKAGLLADLVVWDRDLEAVPTHEVQKATVSKTIFDGKIVYRSNP